MNMPPLGVAYSVPRHAGRDNFLMPATPQITLRLTPTQKAQLNRLALKLGIDRSNVIRLAIARLAESEGIATGRQR